MARKTVDLGLPRDCVVERETDKALLVRIGSGVTSFNERPRWIPKRLITWEKCGPQFAETMHVPAWFARKL